MFLVSILKTTEVYELVLEEIIGSLYIKGHVEHTDLLKKLFKGMQQQTKSVLQFSLKYYSRKNKELKTTHCKSDFINRFHSIISFCKLIHYSK